VSVGIVGADEATLGHRNLISYSRSLAQWGRKGSLHEEAGVLAYAGGSWIPVVGNGAFRTDDSIAPATLIGVADIFFARHKRGYTIKVRDSGQDDDLRVACEASGLVAFGEPVPEMICRRRINSPQLPEGVRLEQVTDADGLADFIAVNTNAYSSYGMPEDVLGDLFDLPGIVLANQDTTIVMAYQEDRPVATAMTYLSDGVASLQWVGSTHKVRHMGLGGAVTVWATNKAFERGASSCTLQASPMGVGLYSELGYETIYNYRDYARMATPDT
jgi:Acetyltransferase (GNAT) domain